MSKLISKTNKRNTFTAFILIVFLISCTPSYRSPTPPSYWPTDGWRSTTPEEQGMDSEILAQMVEHIQQEKLNLHSLLIVRNGYLVNELYVYPYSEAQPHLTFSVTKSVIGTLVGIAIEKGYIKDVHQTLFSLLPDQVPANLDNRKKAITLEDLLTMTSGLDCHENPAPGESFMQASGNWVQFMLDLPMAAQPGTKFNYCTGAVELLSAILQKSTGMTAREFANENLFTPLGIEAIPEVRWPSDPQGVTIGGFELALTPGEMAKLGFMYLNRGQWDGKTILPAKWVTASTIGHANRGEKKEYGYLWWIDPQKKWYAALGRGGQHVFVYPAESLIVVSTADLPYTNDSDLIPIQELIDQYILPAVKSDKALPANSDGVARLSTGTQGLSQPQRTTPLPLPAIASEITGKVYTLENNPFEWHTIIFTFKDGADEATITTEGKSPVTIGLDNVYRISLDESSTFPQYFRGRWENQDTFVVEDTVLGQMVQVTVRFQFSGESIHVIAVENYSGSKVEIQGTLNPAAQ